MPFRATHESHDGGDIDDGALALPRHHLAHQSSPQKHARRIDGHKLIPAFQRQHIPNRATADASIIHQNINAPIIRQCPFNQPLPIRFLRHVNGSKARAPLHSVDIGRQRLTQISAPIGDDHNRTFLGE